MAGGGDNRGGTGALELGLMNALRTGNRNVDLFVVAFLPTLIALVATSSERLRDVIRSAAGTGLRRKKRFERIVRVERAPCSRRLPFRTAAAESSERAFRRRTGRTRSPR